MMNINQAAVGGMPHVAAREFVLEVQRGNVPRCSILSKFAEVPAVQAATPANVWDYGAVVPLYTWSTTAAIDSISSSHANDAVVMVLQGNDENWAAVTQIVTLNGQTRVPLTTPMRRIHRAFNANGVDLQGNVYVYENTALAAGVPVDTSKVRAYVALAEQQTLMSPFTVPLGVTAYFLGLTASISRQPSAANVIFTGSVRPFEAVFRTQIRFNLSSVGSSNIQQLSTANSPFPEKSDFIAHVDVSANGTGASVSYDLLLIENDA